MNDDTTNFTQVGNYGVLISGIVYLINQHFNTNISSADAIALVTSIAGLISLCYSIYKHSVLKQAVVTSQVTGQAVPTTTQI